MKTILFILNRECTYLPPFLTIIDSLCEAYCLKIISSESELGMKSLKDMYKHKNVHFISTITKEEGTSFAHRVLNRIKRKLNIKSDFHKETVRLLNTEQYDFLWVIHEETLYEFKKEILHKKYIVSLYELNDHRRTFLDELKPSIQNAVEVLVPEYNRACILRTWLELRKTPTVIPNKPLNHPRIRNIDNPYSSQLKDKKIILYQGYIQRSRNIDALCEAVKDLPEYTIIIMGSGDKSYIAELTSKYSQITYISFVTPPNHLYITSYAHIAIVKYDFICLNAIFCAPNKTWEYSGFGIPVLCHNLPGLEYTIGKYNAGICTDMDDKESIKSAIMQIDAHYEEYSNNAKTFYDSIDIKLLINRVTEKNIKY